MLQFKIHLLEISEKTTPFDDNYQQKKNWPAFFRESAKVELAWLFIKICGALKEYWSFS